MTKEFAKAVSFVTYELEVIEHDGRNAFKLNTDTGDLIVNRLGPYRFAESSITLVRPSGDSFEIKSLPGTRHESYHWVNNELLSGRHETLPAQLFDFGDKIIIPETKEMKYYGLELFAQNCLVTVIPDDFLEFDFELDAPVFAVIPFKGGSSSRGVIPEPPQ